MCRALREPSNSATKNEPSTFSLQEPLLLIPLGSDPRPGNQEVRAAGESPYSFSTEPLFLIPSRRDRRPGSQEIRLAGMHCTFFRGNQFSSFLPGGTAALEAKRLGSPGVHCTFFQGNQFSSFLPAGTAALEARRLGSPGCTALFFEGTNFPHSFRLGPQPWKPRDRDRLDALHVSSREPPSLIPFVPGTPLATRLSSAVLPLTLRCKEIAEFWQYGKRARRFSDSFRQHPDTVLAKVA